MKMSVYTESGTAADNDEHIAEFCWPSGFVNKGRARQGGKSSVVKALIEFASKEFIKKLATCLLQYIPGVGDCNIVHLESRWATHYTVEFVPK